MSHDNPSKQSEPSYVPPVETSPESEADALISTNPYREMRVELIVPSPDNPRKKFDPAALKELAANIKTNGIIEPIVVRPITAKEGPTEILGVPVVNYEIVAGERRFRAAKSLGLPTVPVLVRQLSDTAALEIMLSENMQRKDIHALDEGAGFAKLIERRNGSGPDVEGIATRMGVTARYIYDRLRLLRLNASARKLFLADAFPLGHAIMLSKLSSADQDRALDVDMGGVFSRQRSIGDEAETAVKAGTAAELKSWIEMNVRLDPSAKETAELFPELHKAVAHSALRVVHITTLHQVSPEVAGEEKILGPKTWKRADPDCPHSALGVVVIGPETGTSFRVCYQRRNCTIHWAAEQREARVKAAERGQSDPAPTTNTATAPTAAQAGADKLREEQDERAAVDAVLAKRLIGKLMGLKSVEPLLIAILNFHHQTPQAMAYLGNGYPAHSLKALEKLAPAERIRIFFVAELMSACGQVKPGVALHGGIDEMLTTAASLVKIDVKKLRKEVESERVKQKALDAQAARADEAIERAKPNLKKPAPKAKPAKAAKKKAGRK